MAAINIAHCKSEFTKQLQELEQLSSQAAVHKRKFEFSVTIVRRFVLSYSQVDDSLTLTSNQCVAYNKICSDLNELHGLFCQYQIHCWAQTTIENPSDSVVTLLCTIFKRLKSNVAALDEISSSIIEYDSPQWMQLHILDLKSIATSFSIYLKDAKSSDSVTKLIEDRLQSINNFVKEYESESQDKRSCIFSPIPFVYQQWRINLEDFEMIKEIGSGISSNVFYGRCKSTGLPVAIKKLKFKKLTGIKLQTFQREISILAATSHPCLLKFVGATDTQPYCIITEWMDRDTLYRELHKTKMLNATKKTIVAFDIARGMQYLHSKHIIHRDLKSLNVLLNEEGQAKIGDFGYSRSYDSEDSLLTQNIGTPHWMAPELLDGTTNYTNKVDVYAYAIVLWEIITGLQPYQGLDPPQIIAQVMIHDLRPPLPQTVNPGLKDLITRCWDRNPDRRPSFEEIVKMFYKNQIIFNGGDKEEFMNYVKQQIGDEIEKENEFESKLLMAQKDEQALNSMVDEFQKSGIPEEMLQRCWETLEKFPQASPVTIGHFCVLFLKTKLKSKAVKVLRMLPTGSVNATILKDYVASIPSGANDFDDDICMCACKNGCADIVVVYSSSYKILKVAMEVVAEQGANDDLRAAVADKCTQYLNSSDRAICCSALRCLIGIGEAKRISDQTLKNLLSSKVPQLTQIALIAIPILSKANDIQISTEIIDALIELSKSDKNAGENLISICSNRQTSSIVLNKYLSRDLGDVNLITKICLSSAIHKDLFPVIAEITRKLNADNASSDTRYALTLIKKYINQESS
ncbi:TKL family protein kinase [Trichomonas vaginalis G3]|uniref:TKL family protein kinase n=1 Tax=Trichomonas vaginalis (strain ATCC PRA-98 / G3) TaxID=412133 RepID=A2EAR6_TRIV3|nr:protein kinase protein [Trichomonas vaginalis G3]EAY10269.1 TKL family protein kinase [Trichomonas vaginalis G3]KAI5487753.1 protein kinase protein [Trichomonas vaginalis G3]|eukprot:XP_001322492.1 TKL family protein kinase [Trichomonas vaginalis G3]